MAGSIACDLREERKNVPGRTIPIRALGKIPLRVRDLDRMQSFYEDLVGLQPMERFPKAAFFRVAEGIGGHTQVFVLFDRGDAFSARPTGTTLDHLAFTVPRGQFEAERARLEQLGLPVQTAEHGWMQWRWFYVKDPQLNEVEWVWDDPDVAPDSDT